MIVIRWECVDRCDIIKEREGKFGKRMRFNFQIRSPFLFCQSVLTKGFENDNIDIKENLQNIEFQMPWSVYFCQGNLHRTNI